MFDVNMMLSAAAVVLQVSVSKCWWWGWQHHHQGTMFSRWTWKHVPQPECLQLSNRSIVQSGVCHLDTVPCIPWESPCCKYGGHDDSIGILQGETEMSDHFSRGIPCGSLRSSHTLPIARGWRSLSLEGQSKPKVYCLRQFEIQIQSLGWSMPRSSFFFSIFLCCICFTWICVCGWASFWIVSYYIIFWVSFSEGEKLEPKKYCGGNNPKCLWNSATMCYLYHLLK